MIQNRKVKIIECPRDAMQGWKHLIPTNKKVSYINELLKAGFDTIDFGSFVSPKAIPQMADTKEVLESLTLNTNSDELLAIVANFRGAQEATSFDRISYIGFPFSVSETFQQRNTNSSIIDSLNTVDEIQELCIRNNKKLVVYLSMGFGNPYGDPYSEEIVFQWAKKLVEKGINIISVADTVGLAEPVQITSILNSLINSFKETEFGVHLHSSPLLMTEKIDAALITGCRRFDSAVLGIGGCPMAGDDLVGNIDTSIIVEHLINKGYETGIDIEILKNAELMAADIFI